MMQYQANDYIEDFQTRSTFNTNKGGKGSLFQSPYKQNSINSHRLTPPASTLKFQHSNCHVNKIETSPSRHFAQNTTFTANASHTTNHPVLTPLHAPTPPNIKPEDLLALLQTQLAYTTELEKELEKRKRLIIGRDKQIHILKAEIEAVKAEASANMRLCICCQNVLHQIRSGQNV